MNPKTLAYFTIQEDKIDEVKTVVREYLKQPGISVQIYAIPYSNRFVAIMDQGGPAMAKNPLVQFLTPRFKELPEFVELEPVASRG